MRPEWESQLVQQASGNPSTPISMEGSTPSPMPPNRAPLQDIHVLAAPSVPHQPAAPCTSRNSREISARQPLRPLESQPDGHSTTCQDSIVKPEPLRSSVWYGGDRVNTGVVSCAAEPVAQRRRERVRHAGQARDGVVGVAGKSIKRATLFPTRCVPKCRLLPVPSVLWVS